MNTSKEVEYIAEIARLKCELSKANTIQGINRSLSVVFKRNPDLEWEFTHPMVKDVSEPFTLIKKFKSVPPSIRAVKVTKKELE